MNIGALMQEVYNIEECGLDRRAIRLHRLAETAYMAEVSSFFIRWFNSRRSNDPSGFGNRTMCFVISCSTIALSLAKNEAKRPPRFRSDSNAVPDSSRNERSQT